MRRRETEQRNATPWLHYEAPQSRDIIRQVSGAPTTIDLVNEREKRIKILAGSRQSVHREVAAKLRLAPYCEPALTAACPLFVRKWQVYVASRMLKAFRRFSNEEIFMVTIGDRQTLTPHEFMSFDIKRFKKRVRKRLERHLPEQAVVFGVCEFDFDSQLQVFRPHCHLFIAGVPRPILDAARWHYLPERNYGLKSLMRIDEVTDLPRQLSYALKTVIYRRPPRVSHRREKGRRLRVSYFRAHMAYLDQHQLGDFIFCINARLHSSKPAATSLSREDIGRAIFMRWLASNS
jgi:hypothetical protein